jgi:radical SAM superfamily enzyme YgiQ (UPF0313 family)
MMGNHFSIVEASRGCPYRCKFCLKSMYPKSYKRKSPVNLFDELTYLKIHHGVDRVLFIDLNFTFDKHFVSEFCDEIKKRNLKLSWSAQCRPDFADEGLLREMKSAGCVLLQYGVESGSQEVLDRIRKGVSITNIVKTFKIIKSVGIKTLTFFMLSSKGEYPYAESLINKIRPDFVSFVPLIDYNDKLYGLSKELLDTVKMANIRFYTNVKNLINLISSVRDLGDIKVILSGFFNIFVPFILRTTIQNREFVKRPSNQEH